MRVLICSVLIALLFLGGEIIAEKKARSTSGRSFRDTSDAMDIRGSDIRGFNKTDLDRFVDDNEQGLDDLVKIRNDWKDRVLESVQFLETEVRELGLGDE